MLEIRPNCEHCGKSLPNTSTEAMICSFECTYCKDCAIMLFENVCPSCGGNFTNRPIRPKKMAEKYPPSNTEVLSPKNLTETKILIDRFKNIQPEKR